MGLDQHAYVATRAGAMNEYYEAEYGDSESKPGTVAKPREIAYWRKHPNLQGWMHQLYLERGGMGEFNGDELELTWEDIERLEEDILSGAMAKLGTQGFFFGGDADEYYREQDLEFVRNAKAELFLGLKVFYNSSW